MLRPRRNSLPAMGAGMMDSSSYKFKKKGQNSLRDTVSRKERELIQQACEDSRFQALFGKHLDAMERDWSTALASLGGGGDDCDTESTSSATSLTQFADEDGGDAAGAAAAAMRRRHSRGQRKMQMSLSSPTATLGDFDPRQSMTEWAKDCIRLCAEAWDMDRLLQERDRLAKQVQRFQEDKIDAQKGYMQELQVLKNQVLQLEKKTPNMEVDVTNDDLCFYEPLRYLPDDIREHVKDVICYKVKQEMDRGADMGTPQREKMLTDKISALQAENDKLQSRLEHMQLEMDNEVGQQLQRRLLKERDANRGNSQAEAAAAAAAAEEAARAAAADAAARRRQAAMEAALADRNKESQSSTSLCPRCQGKPQPQDSPPRPESAVPRATPGPAAAQEPEAGAGKAAMPNFRCPDYLKKKVAALKLSLSAAEFRGEVLASGDKKKLQLLKEKIQGAKAKLAESYNDVDVGPDLVCCATMTEPWAPESIAKPEASRPAEPPGKAPKTAVTIPDEGLGNKVKKETKPRREPPSPSHATQTDPASLSSRFSQTHEASGDDPDLEPPSKGRPSPLEPSPNGASHWRGLQFTGVAAKAPRNAAEAIEKSKQAMRHLRRGCSELSRLQSSCGSDAMMSEGSARDFEVVAKDMSKTIDCIDETLGQADTFIQHLSRAPPTAPAATAAQPPTQQPKPAPSPTSLGPDRSAEYKQQLVEKDQEILDLRDKNTQLELALQEMRDKVNEAKKQLEAAGIDADAIFDKVGLSSLVKGAQRVCVFERLYMDAIERAKRQAARAGLLPPGAGGGVGGAKGGARLAYWGQAFRDAQQAIHPGEPVSPVTGPELQGFLQEAGLGQPGCPHCGMMLQWASNAAVAATAAAADAAATTSAYAPPTSPDAITRAASMKTTPVAEATSPFFTSLGSGSPVPSVASATRRSPAICSKNPGACSLPVSRAATSVGPTVCGTPKETQRSSGPGSLGSAFFPIPTQDPAPPSIGVQGTSLAGSPSSSQINGLASLSLSASLSASGLRQAKQFQMQDASGSNSPTKSNLSRRSLSSPLLGPETISARRQVRLRGPVNLESVPFLISAQSQLGEKAQLPPVDSPGSQERQNSPGYRQGSRGPSNALPAAVDPLPFVGRSYSSNPTSSGGSPEGNHRRSSR